MRPPRPYLITAASMAAIVALGGLAKLASCSGVTAIVANLDGQLLTWFFTIQTPTLDRFFIVVTWAGSNSLLLPLSAVFSIKLLTARQIREAIFLGSSTVGASLLANLGKHYIARPRPALFPALIDPPSGYSFPSSHAAQASAFVLASLWLLKRSVPPHWFTVTVTAGAGLILLACLSRLYLQVHYPSDVLAGAMIAALWVVGLANLTVASPAHENIMKNR